MAIERISFPKYLNMKDGLNLNIKYDPHVIAHIIKLYSPFKQVLGEGDYKLTPEKWKLNPYLYNLTVLENGHGLIRVIPADKSAINRVVRDGNAADLNQRGRIIRFPDDRLTIVLSDINERNGSQRLYEIIRFIPN